MRSPGGFPANPYQKRNHDDTQAGDKGRIRRRRESQTLGLKEKSSVERGLLLIDTAEDRRVATGHAGIGMEILDDMPDVETVIVPTSSGGLIAGVASAIKLRNPKVRVVGVNPEGGVAVYESLRAGEPVSTL